MLRNLVDAADRLYRRTGANLPTGDPTASHGALMEGYFWRATDPGAGRAVVVLCGINRHPDGDWATVAIAAHPGGFVRSAVVDGAWASRETLHVRAGDAVRADRSAVAFDLGDDARVELEIGETRAWPLALGAGGVFSLVPFLSQYWHPHIVGGSVSGKVVVGDDRWTLDRGSLYAEKNWGRGFPDRWWWGQAHDFSGEDVCVAFGGGDLHFGKRRLSVGGVVVRVDDDVVRLSPPTAFVRCDVGNDIWRVRARHPIYDVTIEGDGTGAEPHILPVPVPSERRNIQTDVEHLGARMDVTVTTRRGRLLYRGSSPLAGLETGTAVGAT
jgi:tocopherol cyclase